MDREIKAKLIKVRKDVKRKFDAIKSNRLESEQLLQQSYKPLTEKLEKIVVNAQKSQQQYVSPKLENAEFSLKKIKKSKIDSPSSFQERVLDFSPDASVLQSTRIERPFQDKTQFLEDDEVFGDNPTPVALNEENEEADLMRPPSPINEQAVITYVDQFGPLPRQYIGDYIRDTEGVFDDGVMAVTINFKKDTYRIGNSNIQFNSKNNDFVIDGITYKGTPGLYELLFKKHPIGYNENDKIQYADILKRTDAAMKKHNPEKGIAGNRSDKYRNIVQPLMNPKPKLRIPSSSSRTSSTSSPNFSLPPKPPAKARTRSTTAGKGFGKFQKYNNQKLLEYVYWDDPNELVDRLRLLLASQQAGNNSHHNEINSLISELREAKIII